MASELISECAIDIKGRLAHGKIDRNTESRSLAVPDQVTYVEMTTCAEAGLWKEKKKGEGTDSVEKNDV